VFLDRHVDLPEAWFWNQQRRAQARVPNAVRFATTPEHAIAMLEHAWEQGVPMRWVTGDAPRLREAIQAHGRLSVLAVSATTRVWTARPAVLAPQAQTGGRPRRALRVAPGGPPALMVSQVISSLPSRRWKRLAVMQGEKGPIASDWTRVQVVERRDQLPGPDIWLMARRSLSDPTQIASSLADAPAGTSFETLIRVSSTRSPIEQGIEEAKGETGPDEDDVHFWHRWSRHITLSMMAHAWLASVRLHEQEKNRRGRSADGEEVRDAHRGVQGMQREPVMMNPCCLSSHRKEWRGTNKRRGSVQKTDVSQREDKEHV
jgi:SRSO17 transposase